TGCRNPVEYRTHPSRFVIDTSQKSVKLIPRETRGASLPPPRPTFREVLAMFDLTLGRARDCTGVSRRTFLRVGGLSALGLSLPDSLRRRAAAAGTPDPRAVRCILLWMQGGPSHHDTMDPKPDAPAEVRGEFATIPTTLPGIRFCEHLPLL